MSESGSGDPFRRPNVLFVITDQHRADHVGFGGNDVVNTPHLDALASRSMVFDRTYVANPICAPNRCTIMTGRFPSAHGVVFNDRSLPWGANTFPRVFRAAGYATGLFGKADLQLWRGVRDVDHGPGDPAVFDPYPEGWDRFEDASAFVHSVPTPPEEYYGFERAEFAIGHGAIVGGHHLRWALERGLEPSDVEGSTLVEGPAAHRSSLWSQVMTPRYGAEFHSTEFVTDRTIDFIDRASASGRPWLAVCSYPDPHHPFAPPGQWSKRHAPDDIPLPPTFDDELDDAPEFMRAIAARPGEAALLTPFRPTAAQFREAAAAEYGLIEMVDDAVGRVLETVTERGQADDTIVVFTSDHGDMFGDHGLMLKGMMHWEATTRVPLTIAVPGTTGGRSDALASSVDLAPTLLDLAGLEPYRSMQGHSLAPVVRNPSTRIRDHLLIEEQLPPFIAGALGLPAMARTVITDDARLTRYSTGEAQLFDLASDRDERVDLAGRPAAAPLQQDMTNRLVDELMTVANPAPPGPAPAGAGPLRPGPAPRSTGSRTTEGDSKTRCR